MSNRNYYGPESGSDSQYTAYNPYQHQPHARQPPYPNHSTTSFPLLHDQSATPAGSETTQSHYPGRASEEPDPDPYGYGPRPTVPPKDSSPFGRDGDGDLGSYRPPPSGPTTNFSYNNFYSNPSSNPSGNDPFTDTNAVPLQNVGPDGKFHDPEASQPDRHRHGKAGRPRKSKKNAPWYRKHAYAVWILTAVQLGVFIGELANNAILTGSPFEKPRLNITFGPTASVLINMGARFAPCMRNVDGIQNRDIPLTFPCPRTKQPTSTECTLSELCGFSGVPNPVPGGSLADKPAPDQWFRFIIPMFLHAGIIHIGFNMLLQLTLGRYVEHMIGPVRFLMVYFCAGIFGFVMGGNLSGPAISSTGASGSLFGIIAINLLDLLYNWRTHAKPSKELVILIGDIVFAFLLGLLPGLDNFAHIGGFLMGLAMGVCILHTPAPLRKRLGSDDARYDPVHHGLDKPGASAASAASSASSASAHPVVAFVKNPLGFFRNRPRGWWVWWLVRAGALIGVLVGFVVLLRNFYVHHNQCSWCKFLSCLPVKDWCEIGNLEVTEKTSPARV